jgi:hypothetical protein
MAALAAGLLLACLLIAAAIAHPPVTLTLGLGAAGALILALSVSHRQWDTVLHLAAVALLGVVAAWAEDRVG